MQTTELEPFNAVRRSVVDSILGWAFKVSVTLWATISEVPNLCSSMSCKAIVETANYGKLRMSPSKFLANTVLPAPIRVIFGIVSLKLSYESNS
jgi:hypothetical protein